MITPDQARLALLDSDCLFDEAQVAAAYERLADEIEQVYADLNPIIMVVMNGGFIPAAEIMRRMGFPFEVDYLHATRYRGATTGGGLEWKARPQKEVAGRHVLVIDDILDEGNTLAAVREALHAAGCASLKVAVLSEKLHDRRAPGAIAEFVGLQVADRYVFGCGMDYSEYWRQLPRIHALK